MMSASTDTAASTGEYIYMDLNTGDWGLGSDIRSYSITFEQQQQFTQSPDPRAAALAYAHEIEAEFLRDGHGFVSNFDADLAYINIRTGVWASDGEDVVGFRVTPDEMERLKQSSTEERIFFGKIRTEQNYYDI